MRRQSPQKGRDHVLDRQRKLKVNPNLKLLHLIKLFKKDKFVTQTKITVRISGLFCLLVIGGFLTGTSQAADFSDAPIKGMVTMIDLGAKKCIPCKMMAPILERLEKAYRGKAAIIFIDVWKNEAQAKRFSVQAIPTQIFFDKGGKEVFRHVGFMKEEAIVEQLKKMGVTLPKNPTGG